MMVTRVRRRQCIFGVNLNDNFGKDNMQPLLEAKGLVKRFGALTAVDGISLSVPQGEVLGFLGPNGAGKTTTMKMLTGFLAPNEGEASICGELVTSGIASVRRNIGYLPEGAPLYGEMTPESFLTFLAETHSIVGADAKNAVASAADAVSIDQVMGQRIETLSKGFKRRVGLAGAILHNPKVLILDEPTDGLDPNQKHEVRRLIEGLSSERAIIISTHILEEVDAICDRAVVIREGRIVADDTPLKLKAQSAYAGAVSLLLPLKDAKSLIAAAHTLSGLDRIEQVKVGKDIRVTLLAKKGIDIADSVGDLVAKGDWHVSQYSVDAGRLDDVFRKLTLGSNMK